MKRVTIKQVAQKAGVSFQIVSKVLNDQGRTAPETRERILAAAEELGYVRNRIAHGLVSQRTRTLGFVAGDLSNHFLTQFIVGAEREAWRQGYSFIVVGLETGDASRELTLLLEQQVDGVLLAAPQLEADPVVPEILAGKLPVVSVHRVVDDFVSIVDSDQVAIGQQATRHLRERSFQNIATVTGNLERFSAQLRLQGTRQAFHEIGTELDDDWIIEGNWDPQSGYDAAIQLLKRHPQIDALFVQNDLMAIGVLHALFDLNYRVPEDCAVIGCDDLPISAHTIPPLSSVHIPVYETGQTVVELLLSAIEQGDTFEKKTILLPTQIIERQSTAITC